MILSRFKPFPFRQLIKRSVHLSDLKTLKFYVKHYPVTYLVSLVGIGAGSLCLYSLYVLFMHPNVRMITGERGTRYHAFENEDYGNLVFEYDQPPPLVIMRADGSLVIRDE